MKEVLPISGAFLVLTAIFQTSSANPAGGNVTVGSATITQDGDILSVVTGSTKTVINWDSFSIGANQLTQILQPGANAATLNRVVGTMPSELLGTLISNGKVALINENGILVGNTGIIDTHGFIGSTLNTSNDAFVANGNLVFSGASEASIVNKGAILAREGDVFLLGRNVTNAGSIEAHNGNAGLAAGGEIVLRKASDEHVYVEVKSSSRGDKVVNSGTIKAIQDDLHHNGGNPYQYAMNTGGTGVNNIQIRPGGGVYLNAGTEGSVVHSGAIKAVKGDKGGDVALSGRTVDVKASSTIDASGPKAGGTVKIGGGLHGKDASIANSKATRVEKGATIKADATENGKGGQVVVWSDGATSYQGSISAKGAGHGAGGSAEVSGKEYLDFRGDADLTSASGEKGSLLLDPANITIQASNPDIAGDGTNNDIATAADLDSATLDFPGANSVITTGAVAGLLLTSNLTLAATTDITVADPLAYASLFSLTLDAGHDILVSGAITNTLTGGINLTAGHDIKVDAGISSVVAGAITLSAGNDITVNDSIATLGAVSLNFGQSEGGVLTFGAGGSVLSALGATATGGAGDDTVAFTTTPANNIAIDLAGGANTVNLTSGNDTVNVTAANAISFGSVTVSNVTNVDGLGGTNAVVLTGGDETFTVTGANAGSGSGISFSSIHSIDGNGGLDSLVNTSGAAYDAPTDTVAGVEVIGFATIQTAELNLSGTDDVFIVTGANAGTFSGQNFTGLTTVNSLGGTNEVVLTAGNDSFTVTGTRTGSGLGIAFTDLDKVAGGGGSDILINSTGTAFDGVAVAVGGVSAVNFTTVQTSLLNLSTGDDAFSVTGANAGTFSGQAYTGLSTVDGLGGNDALSNLTAGAFSAATNSVSGVAVSHFETVNTALLDLTTSDDLIIIDGPGTSTFLGINYTGLTHVDGLAGNDIFINQSGGAFSAATQSAGGVSETSFDKIVTSFLTLTAGDDDYEVYGGTSSSMAGVNYYGVTHVDGLGGTNSVHVFSPGDVFSVTGTRAGTASGIAFTNLDSAIGAGAGSVANNNTAGAFDGATSSVAGVSVTGFETINTALLNLTGGDDLFTVTGAGAGTFGAQNFTGLTTVDGLAGTDTLVNNSGLAFNGGTTSVAGITAANFENVQSALISLTGGNDLFTVTGAGTGTFLGTSYSGVTDVDGLGGTDTLVNSTALAFDGATTSVAGITGTNFETVSTALLNLTAGDDLFTVTGLNAGTFGTLNFTNLTQVDGLAGSNTLVNGTVLAFEASTLSVNGVTETNFQTVNTALLNLTGGDDSFALTGAGTGTFAGLSYTGLTSVDALGGSDLFVNNSGTVYNAGTNSAAGVTAAGFETVNTALLALTGGADTFTVTGANSGTYLATNFTGVTSVDGLGGADLLVNGTALAYDGAANSVSGITQTNFETVSTALLNLTTGDDLFTVTGANAGTFGGLNFTNLTQVDGLAGSDTLVNGTALAFEAATLSVSGVTETNFETVNTALLNLTAGDDSFALTGAGTGTFAGLNYTGLSSVDGLAGVNTTVLTGGNDSFTVTGTRAGTGSGVAFTNLDRVDGAGGSDTLVNGTALAFEGSTNSVAGVTQTNFEIIDTARLNLTIGDDLFTVTGSNTGTFGALNFISLTQVDGMAGSDTLVNSTAGAFDGATNTVAGVTESNFETVSTALLTLTGGNDLFTVTGSGTGVFGALNFTNLTQVDALGGSDTVVLTAGNDSLTVTGTGAATTAGIALANIEIVDGSTGTNSITLTSGDDLFTVTGSRAGNGLGIAFSNIDSVDGAGGTNTIMGTAVADTWSITGTNAGSLLGVGFNQFSQLRSGGSAVDVFDFAAGGDITDFISGADGGGLNLAAVAFTNHGVATNLTGSIRAAGLRLGSTAGGSFTLLNAGNNVGTLAANLDGSLSFTNSLGYTVGTVDGVTGITTTGDAISLNSGIGPITLASDLTTGSTAAGDILFSQDVVLVSNATITGGSARFGGAVDGGFGLTVNSAGATTFSGAAGGNVALASLTTDAGGTTAVNGGGITTSGVQVYGDTVTLGAPVSVFTGSAITFAATLDGASATTINAVTTLFSGAVGGSTALTSLTTDAAGTTTVGGLVSTTGSQTYHDAVTLGSATSVFNGAAVTFGSTLDGASDTTVNATTTTFGGTVGGTTALTSLTTDATGSTLIQGPGVHTTGNQTYGDDVVLSGPATLFTGAGVNFGARLDGSSAVVVNAIDTRFGGAVGSGTALVSLTTDAPGTTQIDGGSITTTGAQLYNDDVTLGADATLKAGSLDFKSIAAQLHNLALDSAGAISLGDVLNATKLNLKAAGNILQKTGSKIVVGELSGDTQGRTILFNDGNQIVTIGDFTAGGDLLIFDAGTSGGGAVYGMNVTGDIMGHGSVWLVEGSGGLKVDPTGSVTVDGLGNALLLVGGLDLALGIPGSGELVLK
ncbi:MAG: filamentous hemagglutinin N-terminal protein, partial [Akkermansiaceae bacterium]|nr:filamentous hemagglutinin N-terminal protein [Akkermansiaceae bacterium]